MKRNSVQITTLTILLSILTVIAQFSIYYFLGSSFLTFSLAALIILMPTHIFLEKSLNHESCFSYSLLNTFLCFIIILLSYLGGSDFFLTFQPFLLIFIVINLEVPILYCMFRCLFDRGAKYSHFNIFYRNISIVFLVIYMSVLIFLCFIPNEITVLYLNDINSINFIPFLTLATLIEDFLYGNSSFGNIITYFMQTTFLFIPYGFYTILLLKHSSRLIRFIALLFLPILIEIIQIVFQLGQGDINDIIFALIGGLLGAICYHLLNSIFHVITDEDFLYERSRYSFYRNSLHF
jgi:glycopeptide antibiotics resistance protein